jgi:dihydrofolate reductase
MNNRKVILYIAMSLDGYIAREDGDISFLSVVDSPGEDYGYNDFIQSVDTVIMGRKTYDTVMSFGIDFPHAGRECYVLSRTRTGADENVKYYNGDIADLIADIRKEEGMNIFCDGGSEVVFELMKNNLIDKFIVSVIPILLGKGIPLFKSGIPETYLKLTRSVSFPSGLVQLWYDKKEAIDFFNIGEN